TSAPCAAADRGDGGADVNGPSPAPRPSAGLALKAFGVGAVRALRAEWLGSAPHRWLLANPKPEGVAAEPHAFRPAHAEAGRRLLAGEFRLAGASPLVGPGGDPWDRPSPSRPFADARSEEH